MSDSDDNVVELIDREEAIFKARLAGKSVRRIAREFRTDLATVESVVQRCCPVINTQMRLAALALDLERLDELQNVFYSDAMNGDAQAAAICLKIAERRSCYLGLDSPMRIDPVQLAAEAQPQPTSTERIMAALNRLRYDPLYGGTADANNDKDSPPPAA
jgi:hypothetical protein